MVELTHPPTLPDTIGSEITLPPPTASRNYEVTDVVGVHLLIVRDEMDAENIFTPVSRFWIRHPDLAEVARPAKKVAPAGCSLSVGIKLEGRFAVIGAKAAADGAELAVIERIEAE